MKTIDTLDRLTDKTEVPHLPFGGKHYIDGWVEDVDGPRTTRPMYCPICRMMMPCKCGGGGK